MPHQYYSQRMGINPNISGLPLADVLSLFVKVFKRLEAEGYFQEAFGFECVDSGVNEGKVHDPGLEMHLAIHKDGLWPIADRAVLFSEDDLFDVIEYLFQQVAKPVEGWYHDYAECGMHWQTFNRDLGQEEFRSKINSVLAKYEKEFELSADGEILHKAEAGFEPIFDADLPSKNEKIVARVNAALLRYRRYHSTIDDRRHAVRDLADVLEYLRPKLAPLLTKADEKDLFNIANNFGIRHHNDKQRTSYDSSIWLSWMFYFYLSTIHAALRTIDRDAAPVSPA
jgi:hypothetical protein